VLFISCCGSVAVLRATTWVPRSSTCEKNERRRGIRPRHHDQVPATHNGRRRGQRPGPHAQLPVRRRGQRPGETMKYLRRTTSATAGNGLGTTANEHSPAMHNERRRGKRPGHHDQVLETHYERRRGQLPGVAIKYLRCTTSGAASFPDC
jgi:hypothetical protein